MFKSRYVKELPAFYILPGRKLAELVIETREAIGILASIAGILSKNNINVLYLTCYVIDTAKGRFICFIDVTESKITLNDLKEIIKKQPYTISVDVWASPIDGVIYDKLCFPTSVRGEESLIVRYSTFVSIIDGLRRHAGKTATVIFYHLGYYSGEDFSNYVREVLKPLNVSVVDLVRIAFDLVRSFGDYDPELVSLEVGNGKAIVRVHSSFEANPFRGVFREPSCQFVRGDISGLLSGLVGRKLVAVERKCIASGDPYCEFYVEPLGK